MSGDLTVSGVALPARRPTVSCSFFRRKPELVNEQVGITPFTGHNGARQALRQACQAYAEAVGCTHFAMPDHAAKDGSWLVYRARNGESQLTERCPTRDAAEMWLVHRG